MDLSISLAVGAKCLINDLNKFFEMRYVEKKVLISQLLVTVSTLFP